MSGSGFGFTQPLTIETDREIVARAGRKRKPPSEDAKPEELHNTQISTRVDAVHNERPIHLTCPPLQIYHPVFSKFLSNAFLPFSGDLETLRKTSQLMGASRQYYEHEWERADLLRSLLSTLVHPGFRDATSVPIDDDDEFWPDGKVNSTRLWGSALPVCALLEVKNEVGTGGCDPALQCQSDFVKLCSAEIVGTPPSSTAFADCLSTSRFGVFRAALRF